MPFQWAAAENLFFDIIKIKCVTKTAIHGINFNELIIFYVDASGIGTSFAITQFKSFEKTFTKMFPHPFPENSIDETIKKFEILTSDILQTIEMFVLYDFFSFNIHQRLYFIYKKNIRNRHIRKKIRLFL